MSDKYKAGDKVSFKGMKCEVIGVMGNLVFIKTPEGEKEVNKKKVKPI